MRTTPPTPGKLFSRSRPKAQGTPHAQIIKRRLVNLRTPE
jgi:hypothetical protein